MKICFKCGVSKPMTEFYAHKQMADGHLGKCKDCTKKDVMERYKAKPEFILAYEIKRRQFPERIKAHRQYGKKYREKYPEKRALALLTSRIKNPAKHAARTMVSNYIRDGKLKRLPCEVCGNQKSEAHHEDYSKPLEVKWLCKTHHAELHRKHK